MSSVRRERERAGTSQYAYTGTNSRSNHNRTSSRHHHPHDDIGPEKFASKVFVQQGSGSGGSSTSSSPPPPPPPAPPLSSSSLASSCAAATPMDAMTTEVSEKPSMKRSVSTANSRYRSAAVTGRNTSEAARREANGSWMSESSPPSSSSGGIRTTTAMDPPVPERSRSGSHASAASAPSSASSSSRRQEQQLSNGSNDDTPRRRARKVLQHDDENNGHHDSDTRHGKPNASNGNSTTNTMEGKARPVRIKYENTTRGIGGGKREISHASLGKLIARLTDAHQYDVEFRDVFLLTYRCFCSPYDFIKKLMKRYTAVLTLCGGLDASTLQQTQELLDQITQDEENERNSTSTSISTAKSDINTNMEAQVSIMRLLSVLKFWIKESGFIEMDLVHDRRSQKKLTAFLTEIQTTTPIASIRQHAENLLLNIGQLARQHAASSASSSSNMSTSAPVDISTIPPPPPLSASTSVSSVSSMSSEPVSQSYPSRTVVERSTEVPQSKLSSAMSKLKLTRSSSDSKKDKALALKLRNKHPSMGDVMQNGPRDDGTSGAPKMLRGVTTGSAEADLLRGTTNPLEDVIHDTIQRARLASRHSSRSSYDNSQPLSGMAAQDIADQLTLMEAESYFSRINPRELTNKAWTRETKYKEAPHVMALIELFDATAEWVSSEILHPHLQASERAKLIMLFIDAADYCYQMNNFNTLFEITTGLSAPCIRQLSTTWGLVHATSQEKLQVLMQVCSPDDNYRNYRQAFALTEGQPRLPCSFILVKDLFTLEEAMKSIEDGLVNWQKFRKIHKVISEALERQNMNYLPADGSAATGISRKGKGALRHDRKVQVHIRHRLDTIRQDSSVLYQLARNANTQESILFVNSLSEAGFL